MASDPRLVALDALLKSARDMLNSIISPMPDAIITMPQDVTVTPTVQSDGYEFEVQHHRDVPTCTHQHQKLVGNELRCANCDAVLQVTGVVGRNITTAPWAEAAAEGSPDQPNRE